MICILVGFEIKSQIDLSVIPSPYREGLLTGETDYNHRLIGYVALDMGPDGIEPIIAPVDLKRFSTMVSLLGASLGFDSSCVRIAEVRTDEWPLLNGD